MDISSVASGVTAAQTAMTNSQIGVSVERKALDIQAQEGQALISMMNSGAGIGSAINTQG